MPVATSTALALAAMAASTGSSVYAANKASKAAKLPPEQQRAQLEAQTLANNRMKMTEPLYGRLIQGAGNRLAASTQPGYQAQGGYPSMPRRSPGMGQAVSQLARNMPPPRSRQPRRPPQGY
jgi:hypothetical protein